jgi:hypothetical protein
VSLTRASGLTLASCVTHACGMSDATIATACIRPCCTSESRLVNRQAFLDAFEAKGCKTSADRAALLGVPVRSVQRYLKGDVVPAVTRAQTIASRLDLSVADLWNAA